MTVFYERKRNNYLALRFSFNTLSSWMSGQVDFTASELQAAITAPMFLDVERYRMQQDKTL